VIPAEGFEVPNDVAGPAQLAVSAPAQYLRGNATALESVMSGTGKDYLHSVNEALRNYEDAIIQREKFKPLESKVTRQQDVDSARQKVVDVVVEIVTGERMKSTQQ
jgi:hypothetical protein